jgi:hypothetical protein
LRVLRSGRFGHIDAAVYSPGGLDQERVSVLDLDPVALPGQLGRSLPAPIALTRLLLPGTRERGNGVLLSAVEPMPQRLLATEAGAAAFPGFDVDALKQLTIEPEDVAWNLQLTRDRLIIGRGSCPERGPRTPRRVPRSPRGSG